VSLLEDQHAKKVFLTIWDKQGKEKMDPQKKWEVGVDLFREFFANLGKYRAKKREEKIRDT